MLKRGPYLRSERCGARPVPTAPPYPKRAMKRVL